MRKPKPDLSQVNKGSFGKIRGEHHRRTQPGNLRVDVPSPRGRFRTITADDGIEFTRLPHLGRGDGCTLLLRHAPSLVGTRHQREHQRALTPVPAEGDQLGCTNSKPMRCHRRNPQHPTPKKTWLPNTQSMLQCCTTKLMLRAETDRLTIYQLFPIQHWRSQQSGFGGRRPRPTAPDRTGPAA
jgi:hypothetical protein